jgi:hypothetical protein
MVCGQPVRYPSVNTTLQIISPPLAKVEDTSKPQPGATQTLRSQPRQPRRTLVAKFAPQVFSGIAPGQYARLIEKAKAAGIDLSGNSGTATKFGVEVSWATRQIRSSLRCFVSTPRCS